MEASVESLWASCEKELAISKYKFKVEHNDVNIVQKDYLDRLLGDFTQLTQNLRSRLGRKEMRDLVKSKLNEKMDEILHDVYWASKDIDSMSECKSKVLWAEKLSIATSLFTRVGVGKIAVTAVTDMIQSSIKDLANKSPLTSDQRERSTIDHAIRILNDKSKATSLRVENSIEPFKYEVEVTSLEWETAKQEAINILCKRVDEVDLKIEHIKGLVGNRKLRRAMRENTIDDPELTQHALDAHLYLLTKTRLKSRISGIMDGCNGDPKCCPEIHLAALNTKLVAQAVLFADLELVRPFFDEFPSAIRSEILECSDLEIRDLVCRDEKVKNWIEMQQRIEVMGNVIDELKSIQVE